ncbi:MAG: hypothetical protein J5950_04015 [Clostridia bacterium]|nr:hypothetical protein [Clostridia bacterium]
MKKNLVKAISLIVLTALAVVACALPALAGNDGEWDVFSADGSDVSDPGAQEEEQVELEYVHFIATGNDPYGSFHYVLDGDNTTIDPDEVVWAAIRYRTVSQYDSTGVEFKGQLYVVPPAEPCIPVTYVFSGEWETAIVDLTSVSANTELDSIWDSTSYVNVDLVRFDPLEPDRDSEKDDESLPQGKVKKGDCIDVAWIAFFDNEYAARTYTGREKTPVAILDADSLSSITNAYHLIATKLSEMAVLPTVAPATEVPTAAPTKEPTEVPVTAVPTDAPVTDGSANTDPGKATPSNSSEDKKGGNTGLIIGIAAAVVVCAGIAAFVLIKKKKK